MNILSIHTSHDGAISIARDNELIVHCEISRFSKFKRLPIPSYNLFKAIASLNLVFDVVLLSYTSDNMLAVWRDFLFEKNSPIKFIQKYIKPNAEIRLSNKHHDFHAASANSFCKDTKYLVWDGNGCAIKVDQKFTGVEQTSFYDKNLTNIKKFLYSRNPVVYRNETEDVSSLNLGIGEGYTYLTRELGLFAYDHFAEGKAMAFSSYGKINKEYLKLILTEQNSFNKNFISEYPDYNGELNTHTIKNFNTEKSNDDAKDFAFTFQKVCEYLARDYFKKLNINDSVTLTGGVAQNILINTELSKTFDFDIHVDPICNDQGISLGHLNYYLKNKLERPVHCYLGFKPEYNLNTFDKRFTVRDTDAKEIASKLFEDPVAIFQGRSEQGQRALGNRSLLMNAANIRCLEKINTIKKREWYRPFACTILSEYFEDYFVRDSSRSAEYMMNVFTAKDSKKEHLENVLCPQGTSRVQELKKDKNTNYYNLIKTFFDLYKIPFVLNTSLNTPGLPIVETLDDLKEMMLETNLKYAYLPEKQKIIIKNED
tara:strand:+ start:70 stop:1692 length:1623 start_codon:yes stop_codon:yes gene_type:complete